MIPKEVGQLYTYGLGGVFESLFHVLADVQYAFVICFIGAMHEAGTFSRNSVIAASRKKTMRYVFEIAKNVVTISH